MGGWEKTDWQNKYINIHYIKKIASLLQCSIVLMTGNWILAKSSLDLGDRHLFSKAYSQGQIKEALNIPYLCCYKLRLLGYFPCSEHISSSFLCVFFWGFFMPLLHDVNLCFLLYYFNSTNVANKLFRQSKNCSATPKGQKRSKKTLKGMMTELFPWLTSKSGTSLRR